MSPIVLNELTLSPGERAEIVVDLTADLGKILTLVDSASGADLLTLSVDKAPARATFLPARLTTLEYLDPATVTRTRVFTLSMGMGGGMGSGMGAGMSFLINGQVMDMARIDQAVPLGDTEIWEVRNADADGMTHSFHVHGTHFTVLERNGSTSNVPAHEKGYKDTVLLSSGEAVRLLVRMTDYTTDASAPYMFHCHILEHEDRGMMGQFIVV